MISGSFLESGWSFSLPCKSSDLGLLCRSRNLNLREERYRRAYQDLGDYGSGNIFTSLMGAQPRREAARVLPQPAKPFLKSLTPNFQVDWVS